jgi:hypothetical protein
MKFLWKCLLLVAAVMASALLLGACGGEEEEGATTTPAATATPQATPSPQATPTPTPEPPTQQVRKPTWTISQPSSAGQVQIVIEDGLNTYTIASLDPEMARSVRWEIAFVADVNADGLDDAIVNYYTGGAHCCFVYLIFSEGPAGIQLIDSFSLDNATIRAVKDLDGDGMPELATADDRLAYFPDLSFAVSPFLPLVLCRSTEHIYYDCTPRFPEVLQSSAQEFEEQLRDAVQRQAGEAEARSPALGLLATYLRLKMDEEGWSRVRSLCPECEGWLMQNVGELEQRLSSVQPSRQAPPPPPQ